MKFLVGHHETGDANLLWSTVGEDAEGAEVLVVSPATHQSKLAFWVSDADDAIAEPTPLCAAAATPRPRTRARPRGIPPNLIQRQLGHTKLGTTSIDL